MRAQHLPPLSPRFWFAVSLVSVLGADIGDLFSHDFGLGHLGGLPYLAAAFAATLLLERVVAGATEAFYWIALILLRTAATNLGDLATHDFKFDDLETAGLLALVLALCLLIYRARRLPFLDGAKPRVDALYWFTMLVAGTLGTTLGDGSADALSLGLSTLAWLAIWGGGLGVTLPRAAIGAIGYWVMIAVVRTVGTNVGDWTAGRHGFHLGLQLSTAICASLFLALVGLWEPQPAERAAEPRTNG